MLGTGSSAVPVPVLYLTISGVMRYKIACISAFTHGLLTLLTLFKLRGASQAQLQRWVPR